MFSMEDFKFEVELDVVWNCCWAYDNNFTNHILLCEIVVSISHHELHDHTCIKDKEREKEEREWKEEEEELKRAKKIKRVSRRPGQMMPNKNNNFFFT